MGQRTARAIVMALIVAAAACSTADPPAEPQASGPTGASAPSPPTPESRRTAPPSEDEPTEAAPQPTATAPAPRPTGPVRVRLVPIARLDAPIAMADRPGDDALYVAERAGVIRRLDPATGQTQAVLDMRDQTVVSGEQGLLGIEFSPDGNRLFTSYTDTSGDSRVDVLRMRGQRALEESRRQLFFADQPYSNHNGGNIALGPDDRIYLALGDGGSAGDPQEAAQDPSSPLGKIFRLGGEPEQLALGLRNPWRFSFDRETGDLWIGDVGQGAREEIDRIPFNRLTGSNFGWDNLEGDEPFEGGGEPRGYVPPVHDYGRDDGACSVTGGYVYRGRTIPGLVGQYVYGDYCDGRLRALRLKGRRVIDRPLRVEVDSLVSFGEDRAGELYALSLAGPIYRIEAR